MKLELAGITKRFGTLVANDGVDLTVEAGEIHCLLGENGAGKSTLMNVLFGLLRADAGEIRVADTPVHFADPGDAIAAGIGMVHQHFMLVPVFTVAENVVLGFEPTRRGGFLDRRAARADIRRLSAEFGLEVDPDALVEDLPVGLQQRVEILKALLRDVNLLILDEPTAVLTPQETESLFTIMRSLASSGRSILFITHKLKEVLAVADRITVMRQGRVVGTTAPADTSEEDLATMMVGRNVDLVVRKEEARPGDKVLELTGLTIADDRGITTVNDVALSVRAGEVVALAGVQGNGQTELAEALLGLRGVHAGSVRLDGTDITGRTPRQALRAGIAYIPEDRQHEGLVLGMSIADNLVLDLHNQRPYARRGARDLSEVRQSGERKLADYDIRATSVETPVGTLSGGNQQKVVVARELSRPIRLLVAAQPTRGLDVGSIEYVHRRIIEERDRGTAVLLISSELDEILALADQVAVMCQGRIVGVVPPSVGRERIGLMMGGTKAATNGDAPVAEDGGPPSG
jgi:general nucleoside transport system ATP-binding protein